VVAAQDEGGGYLIEFPDLPGCMSDGATIEEAITNGIDAIRAGSRRCAPRAIIYLLLASDFADGCNSDL
jgi:hypothetical protein